MAEDIALKLGACVTFDRLNAGLVLKESADVVLKAVVVDINTKEKCCRREVIPLYRLKMVPFYSVQGPQFSESFTTRYRCMSPRHLT